MNRSQFKIRSTLIFLVFCSLYCIILVNLYYIQIHNKDFYSSLGTKQYNVTVTQTPERALIYDRNNQPLTLNKQHYAAFIVPKKIQSPETLEPFLLEHFPHAYKRLEAQRASSFMFIKRKLTDAEIALIKSSKLQDLHLLREPNRYYPLHAAGPLVGITDIDNSGLFGIEKLYNAQLVGSPTTHILEKDARSGNFYFAKETKSEGKSSTPVTLTIDRDLQFLVYQEVKDVVQRFAAKEGAAIIMDPENGDILAMVQYPTFDPNDTTNLDIAQTKLHPLVDTYEPGSVIKPFVALAALQEGVVSFDEEIDCESEKYAYIQGMKIGTPHAHGVLTFAQVIQKSNNIGIVKVAQRLGQKLHDYYKKLGFGKKTEIEGFAQHEGFVNPPEKWSKRSLSSLSFGYELTVTLLQIAQAYSVIAQHGFMVQPRLVLEPLQATAQPQQIFDSTIVAIIREILNKAITPQATGRYAAIEGFTVMGKTGTTNIVSNGVYDNTRNIFTFAGIVEKDNYKRVIVTFIREAGYKNLFASQVTAPLFVRIAERMIIHDKKF
jgi:cell division protein FtsI (penicillin-binding protein 3)